MSTFLIRNENGSNSNIDPFCIYKTINFLFIKYDSYIAIFSLIYLLLTLRDFYCQFYAKQIVTSTLYARLTYLKR